VELIPFDGFRRSTKNAVEDSVTGVKTMPKRLLHSVLLASVLAACTLAAQSPPPDPPVSERARRIHMNAIVVDTHADTPQRMLFDKTFDLGERHSDGSIDIPRMREGGVDAEFFSIWVSSDITGPPAVRRALDLIDAVREAVRAHPDELLLATTAADIRRATAEHKIAVLMGMEGGHMIDDDLRLLRDYAALGVRYLTLTHFKNNDWADSSTDQPAHNGLTSFGKDVIRELNRLGVMVDVSHVSDKTFYDAIEVSKVPVIASHSSCRAISDHPRNMSDEMMRALAKNGGVIMINYEASFLSDEFRKAESAQGSNVVAQLNALEAECKGDDACVTLTMNRISRRLMQSGKLPRVSWEEIVEHIDHAVKVAGVDHVGLGSDFDGATMPIGMEDASKLPHLTDALLKKGYSEADIDKILGANILRVMEQVERHGH
jgi:membrane dipeptidase